MLDESEVTDIIEKPHESGKKGRRNLEIEGMQFLCPMDSRRRYKDSRNTAEKNKELIYCNEFDPHEEAGDKNKLEERGKNL